MKKSKKTYWNISIGLIICLVVFCLLKPVNGLTDVGVKLLSAFIAIIYWWITIGVSWTTVVVVPLIAICGAMSVSEAVSTGLGNQMSLFIIMTGMMNIALIKTGCIERFIIWFITRKVVKGRPYMFIFLYSLAIYLLSLVMAGATVCIIAIPIIKGFCEELGFKQEDKFAKTLYMLANWISLLGFVATPIGHSTSLLCISSLQSFGYNISFSKWMLVGIPISIIWFVLIMLTVRLIYRVDTEKYSLYDIEKKSEYLRSLGPLDLRGKLTVLIFLASILLFFVPDLLKGILPGLASACSKLGNVTIVIFAVVLMSVIHVDEKPLLDFNKSITEIEWGPVFMNIAMYPISAALTSENSGISAWLQYTFKPMAENITSWIPFVIFVALVMIVFTQFMACRTIMVIGIMVAVPVAISLGINPIAIAMICCFTANMGLVTPPASGGAAVVLSAGYLSPKDGFIMGWPALPQGVVIALLTYPLVCLLF